MTKYLTKEQVEERLDKLPIAGQLALAQDQIDDLRFVADVLSVLSGRLFSAASADVLRPEQQKHLLAMLADVRLAAKGLEPLVGAANAIVGGAA